jgi:hypothetical protein
MELSNQIIASMDYFGFTATKNDFCIKFMLDEPIKKYIVVTFYDTVECWKFDEISNRFVISLQVKYKVNFTFAEWLMVMHLGEILSIPEMMNKYPDVITF